MFRFQSLNLYLTTSRSRTERYPGLPCKSQIEASAFVSKHLQSVAIMAVSYVSNWAGGVYSAQLLRVFILSSYNTGS